MIQQEMGRRRSQTESEALVSEEGNGFVGDQIAPETSEFDDCTNGKTDLKSSSRETLAR